MIAVVAHEVIQKKIVLKTSNELCECSIGNILFYPRHIRISQKVLLLYLGMNLGVIGSLVGVLKKT
jgi:hypothetical protein